MFIGYLFAGQSFATVTRVQIPSGDRPGTRYWFPDSNPRPTRNRNSSTLFLAIFDSLDLATTPANSLKFCFS